MLWWSGRNFQLTVARIENVNQFLTTYGPCFKTLCNTFNIYFQHYILVFKIHLYQYATA